MTPMPHHHYSPDLTPSNFSFFSADEKSLQRKNFADVEVVKQKTAQTLKGIKIDEFKNYFEQWKNISIDAPHQMESALKVAEV